MDILNSEGTIMGIERIHERYFIKIKKHSDNEYAFFPTNKIMLQKYFAGEITTRELLIPLNNFSFIDDFYTEIDNSFNVNAFDDILGNL